MLARDNFFDDPPAKPTFGAPKAGGFNLTIDGGFAYMLHNIGDKFIENWQPKLNLSGATVALGWRVDQYNKIQLDLALLSGNKNESFPDGEINYKISARLNVMPVLLSWSACIPFDKAGRWEWRISPAIGMMNVKPKITISRESGNGQQGYSEETNNKGFTYGLGTGFMYHINSLFYIDAGCRYLASNIDSTLRMKSTTLTCVFGWKF